MSLLHTISLAFLMGNAANGVVTEQQSQAGKWYMIVESPSGTVVRLEHFTKEECEHIRDEMLKVMSEKIKTAECFVQGGAP